MYRVYNACATQQAKVLQQLFERSLTFRVVQIRLSFRIVRKESLICNILQKGFRLRWMYCSSTHNNKKKEMEIDWHI